HVPRLPRVQDRERADREGDRAARGALGGGAGEGRGADDRRGAPRGDQAGARETHGRREPRLCRARGDLRRARRGGAHPPAPGVPRDRDLGARDRGDGVADRAADRAAASRGRRRVSLSPQRREKPPVPWWRWATWWPVLIAAVVVFYVL